MTAAAIPSSSLFAPPPPIVAASEPVAPPQVVVAPQVPTAGSDADRRSLAQQLRAQTLACRVRHEKFGVRKALTREQLRLAADAFDAETRAISAAKKLIDTKDPAWRAVVNVRSRANDYWKSVTTPYPEPGIRLIRRSSVEAFAAKMNGFRNELRAAAKELQGKYAELRDRARVQLGTLFNESDYPARVDVEFTLEWDFPSIEPPAYLKDLHPHLYEQECQRIAGRFEEAVHLAESAFVEQFQKLVAHLADRLAGEVDGKPKVFRDSAVANLNEFFEQFRQLNIGSAPELAKLVDQAKQITAGITPDDLRANTDVRDRVAGELGAIQKAMDELMVARPKRAIRLEDES